MKRSRGIVLLAVIGACAATAGCDRLWPFAVAPGPAEGDGAAGDGSAPDAAVADLSQPELDGQQPADGGGGDAARDGGPDSDLDLVPSPWSQALGGSGDQTVMGLAADSQHAPCVVGYYNQQLAVGSELHAPVGGADAFVACFAADGAPRWSESIGSAGTDRFGSVAIDGAGDVHLAGHVSGPAVIGGTPLPFGGNTDVVVASFAANGVLKWIQSFGGGGFDDALDVAVGGGRVLVTGELGGPGTLGGDLAPARGIFVAAYDPSDGAHLWSKVFSNGTNSQGQALAVSPDGTRVFVGARISGSGLSFGGPTIDAVGGRDIALAALSSADGAHIWSKRFGSAGDEDVGDLAVDADRLYLTGTSSGVLDFGGGSLPSAGAYAVALDHGGGHVWSARVPSARGTAVSVGEVGSVLFGGNLPGNSAVALGNGEWLNPLGNSDGFVIERSAVAGTVGWHQVYAGPGGDQLYGVVAADAGHALIAGYFGGTADFGQGALVAAGSRDGYCARVPMN